ncbi:MAG: YdcF family protein [Acidimicrobiia bacterium]
MLGAIVASPARRVLTGLVALVLAYFGATFVQVWLAGRRDGARPAEALIVLGAAQYDGRPSPVLAARLDHAADLYSAGLAPVVVVTGGRADGDRFSESAASAAYLHSKGVPDEAILREVQGRNSWDSLAASARFLRREGIDEVVLVSDPFHAARIKAMAEELGLDAVTSPTRTSPIDGAAEVKHMLSETAKVGVGRVIGFRRLVRAGEVSNTGRAILSSAADVFGLVP